MVTLAEKWFQQDERKGLLKGIELGLKLKFGHDGLKIRWCTNMKICPYLNCKFRQLHDLYPVVAQLPMPEIKSYRDWELSEKNIRNKEITFPCGYR